MLTQKTWPIHSNGRQRQVKVAHPAGLTTIGIYLFSSTKSSWRRCSTRWRQLSAAYLKNNKICYSFKHLGKVRTLNDLLGFVKWQTVVDFSHEKTWGNLLYITLKMDRPYCTDNYVLPACEIIICSFNSIFEYLKTASEHCPLARST